MSTSGILRSAGSKQTTVDMMHIKSVAIIVNDYDAAIDFFVSDAESSMSSNPTASTKKSIAAS